MLTAIKYNLANLTTFHGRDARQTFWFYVLFLVLVQMAVSIAITVPLTGSMMGEAVVAVREGAQEADIQQRVFAQMGTMMRVTMWASVALSLAMVALLGASFVRRLHDADKPGWIAAVAAAIQIVSLALTVAAIDEAVQMMVLAQSGDIQVVQAMQSRLLLQSVLAWIPSLLLIVFGVWPSTPGNNRHGPQPASA